MKKKKTKKKAFLTFCVILHLIFEDEFIDIDEILDRSTLDAVDKEIGGDVGEHH